MYPPTFERKTVVQATNEFTIALEPNCVIEIVLLDGDSRITPSGDLAAGARHLDGQGTVVSNKSGSTLGVQVDSAGRWEISVEGVLDGYRPARPVVVTAIRGETVQC